jgi:acylphosphatase
MTESARSWVVAGRVQGVGYRWWAHHTAQRLGLRGWVRNLPDGRVEVVAAGPAESLASFERRLWNGPPVAHVDSVEKLDIPHETVDAKSFLIR